MDVIHNLLNTSDLQFLKLVKAEVEAKIKTAIDNNKIHSRTADINEYIVHEKSFLESNSLLFQNLVKELEDLELHKSAKSGPENVWISNTNLDYVWKAGNKSIVNQPRDLENYKCIKDIMHKINTDKGLLLNSCLVTYYKAKDVYLRLHSDREDEMDQSQPICVLSIGANRPIQFLRTSQDSKEDPILSIDLAQGSLYSMLPGSQSLFKHRVPKGTVSGHRFSLSFRRVIDSASPLTVTPLSQTPVKQIINKFENGLQSPNSSCLPYKQSASPPAPSPAPLALPNSPAFFPDPNQVHSAPTLATPSITSPSTTVIFGTSITTRIDPNRLANGIRKCVNISNSGDKIKDIIKRVDVFYEDPATRPDDIEKVIFRFGTNDIRFQRGVYQYRPLIIDLIHKCKLYFPQALIYVQCILPIKIRKDFIGYNFTTFNNMLFNICATEKCYFLDIFHEFVAEDWMDYNRHLFRDNLHLNRSGIIRLAYWFRRIINKSTRFNHLVQ